MSKRLNYDKETLTTRMMLTLPLSFARDYGTNVYNLFRSLAEVFSVATDAIDELFENVFIESASGGFLDDYIYQLITVKRKTSETDQAYRDRYYKRLLKYNGTREGVSLITFDVLGVKPVALVDKSRGAFFDSLYYFNDVGGGSVFGGDGGQPFTGFIILPYEPTQGQIDELCFLLNEHKSLGVRIYLKFRKYNYDSTDSFVDITKEITGQNDVRYISGVGYGDYFDSLYWFSDSVRPAIYGQEDDSDLGYKVIHLKEFPPNGVLDELLEALSEANSGSTLFVRSIIKDHGNQ